MACVVLRAARLREENADAASSNGRSHRSTGHRPRSGRLGLEHGSGTTGTAGATEPAADGLDGASSRSGRSAAEITRRAARSAPFSAAAGAPSGLGAAASTTAPRLPTLATADGSDSGCAGNAVTNGLPASSGVRPWRLSALRAARTALSLLPTSLLPPAAPATSGSARLSR